MQEGLGTDDISSLPHGVIIAPEFAPMLVQKPNEGDKPAR